MNPRFHAVPWRALIVCLSFAFSSSTAHSEVLGWTNWRGPYQNGTSDETDLVESWTPGGENHLWTYEIAGRGSVVVAETGEDLTLFDSNRLPKDGGKITQLYGLGYRGEGPDLQEILFCLSPDTGELVWEHGFNDFMSDTVYDRYSIGAPVVDRETGNIYAQTTAGILVCVAPHGKKLWEVSLMERFGRLTFPNGRTGAPVIEGDLVIVNVITSYWGADGPARNRFYAFDKKNGELVWSCTPGIGPKDSSFATPVLAWKNGRRVFYCGTGCGNVVCIDARTGESLWRFWLSTGGINSSVLLYGNKLIAIHGMENVDSSETGRMVAIDINAEPKPSEEGAPLLGPEAEIWRNKLCMFTSSPTLVGNRIYQVDQTGNLSCIDGDTGKILWQEKLGGSQLHASPLYADGKLYIPMEDGSFYILRPSDQGAEILAKVQLEGNALGSPTVWNGKIYVHTTKKLYCFGDKERTSPPPAWPEKETEPKPGAPVALQVVPSDVLLEPGKSADFRVFGIDANGARTGKLGIPNWESFIPPTAKVKATMDGAFNEKGELVAHTDAKPSAGAFKATLDGLSGVIRGRVQPSLPYSLDFESFETNVPHPIETGVQFAYPPLPWIGARFKWEIRELEGNKVFAKTLDNVLFQRAITFIGDPEASNYTAQVDVMTDGNRRMRSNGGIINQRYIISLVGNAQLLEVSSNYDRINVSVPFKWEPKKWYRLKTRVDLAEDGSGVVRAKAWPREDSEPLSWTIEVPHKSAHAKGAPGLYGFSPQSKFSVYLDNVVITPNE